MKIKICGLCREEDIDYVNEALPDYAGFVFAESRRQLSYAAAELLRSKLSDDIIPVGVFYDAPIAEISSMYKGGIINIAQLHGNEDVNYIKELKDSCDIPIIKAIVLENEEEIISDGIEKNSSAHSNLFFNSLSVFNTEYLLVDSGRGSGKSFNWAMLDKINFPSPWFLAGGINIENIKNAMSYKPYGIDVSGGAETDGFKDREKILQLTMMARKEN